MRYIVSMLFLFAIVLPCHSQGDKPKPNTLTPKEIADGSILLFDGETTFGWTFPNFTPRPSLKANNAALELIDDDVRFTTRFTEFQITIEYRCAGDAHIALADDDPWKGLRAPLIKSNDWTQATIRAEKESVRFAVPGHDFKFPWRASGFIGFLPTRKANLTLRNIKLRPLNTTSLFNDKDLTGWNVFPGKKSKFAVVDGAINVKDGPGDLQTVGKYKDFILQLECKSNGKHLNSGIFFRCRDGEYQNGYEAQIHNGFTEQPTKKLLVEEYDPKTNKLVGKKEIMTTALDYGTGAIYRRVPARKQMSKDGEWFTMTIVAHGNHFATWVNGVQVTDWTDNRPKSDNARTGCRLEGGHISIQGHDPTTDLSFRNLRIAELK